VAKRVCRARRRLRSFRALTFFFAARYGVGLLFLSLFGGIHRRLRPSRLRVKTVFYDVHTHARVTIRNNAMNPSQREGITRQKKDSGGDLGTRLVSAWTVVAAQHSLTANASALAVRAHRGEEEEENAHPRLPPRFDNRRVILQARTRACVNVSRARALHTSIH